MRDGWYFHDIKVKFILFIYKIQYIFYVDSLIFLLLISLYLTIPSCFQACSYTHILKAPASLLFLPSWHNSSNVFCVLPITTGSFFSNSNPVSVPFSQLCPYCQIHETLLWLLTGTLNRIWQNWSHFTSLNTVL